SFAATASGKTNGKAVFTPATDIVTPVKPGETTHIDPENPITAIQTDGIQLIYVPNFNFGTNKVSLLNKSIPAEMLTYNKKGETTKYEIPHFVQVGDASGKVGTKWTVTAAQDDVFKSA